MNNNSSSGIGILGILQIIFIVLKLLKLINWSWWVVLIPLWIDIGLAIIIIVIYVMATHTPDTRDINDFFNYR